MRNLFLVTAAMLVLASSCFAQTELAGVDVGEIYRRGDMVEYVDGYKSPIGMVRQAMVPPKNDVDKWFVSVLTTPGCSGCEVLKREWKSNDWLLALANPNDSKKSWSHFQVYDTSDTSQAFRFKTLKVTKFPTVLVQPPRCGQFGDPSTVVYQGVYKGNPRKLAEAMSHAIRAYVAKLAEREAGQVPWQPRNDPEEDEAPCLFPPFMPNSPDITIPPIDVQLPSFPWQAILGSFMTGAWWIGAVLIGIWAIKAWRAWRKSRGEKLLFQGDLVDRLLDGLQDRFTPKTDEPDAAASESKEAKKGFSDSLRK